MEFLQRTMAEYTIIFLVYAEGTFSEAASCDKANRVVSVFFELNSISTFVEYLISCGIIELCFFDFRFDPFIVQMVVGHMMFNFIGEVGSFVKIKSCTTDVNLFRFD